MFHDRLRLTRMHRELKQQQMADFLHMSLRNYQKYEEGVIMPTIENLVILADVLVVSVDFLLERDEFLEAIGVNTEIPLKERPRRNKN